MALTRRTALRICVHLLAVRQDAMLHLMAGSALAQMDTDWTKDFTERVQT